MLAKIKRLLNWELKIETVEIEIPEWNVSGRKPSDEDILYVLFQSYEKNGHIYLNNEMGYPIAGTADGMLFRYIMFWLINHETLDEGELLKPYDLGSTCGDKYCIRESHTKDLRPIRSADYGRLQSKVPTYRPVTTAPKPKAKKQMLLTKEEADRRRLRCISRKIWLSEAELRLALKELGTAHRGYPCKLGCNGYHTSSKKQIPKNVLRKRNRSMPY